MTALPAHISVGDPITAALINKLINAGAELDYGTITISTPVANTVETGSVTFRSGWFSSPPYVFTSLVSTDPSVASHSHGNVTTSGCDIHIKRSATADTIIRWVAINIP